MTDAFEIKNVIIDLEICHKDVHDWGAANQVVFEFDHTRTNHQAHFVCLA